MAFQWEQAINKHLSMLERHRWVAVLKVNKNIEITHLDAIYEVDCKIMKKKNIRNGRENNIDDDDAIVHRV